MPKRKATEEAPKPKQIGPFDILKLMFVNRPEFWKTPNDVLAKNYFIINERMSIQFPMQAAVFNHAKINPAEVIKCWTDYIQKKGYNSVPGFVFIQGKKKAADTNLVQKKKYPEKTLQDFAWHMNLSMKDLKYAMSIYPVQVANEIDTWEKQKADLEKMKSLSLSSMKKGSEEQEVNLEELTQDGVF